jgi:hypothetical protein
MCRRSATIPIQNMTKRIHKFITENRWLVSILLTMFFCWMDIHNQIESKYSLIEIFYHLRTESDLGGLVSFFVIIVIYFLITFYLIKFITRKKLLISIVLIVLLFLFHFPWIYIGVKRSPHTTRIARKNHLDIHSYTHHISNKKAADAP